MGIWRQMNFAELATLECFLHFDKKNPASSKISPSGRSRIDKIMDKGIYNFLATKIDLGGYWGKTGLNCWA